jgi:integrase
MDGAGELIPLLQITPSKTDSERLLVVSPELADVLSAIINRVRGGSQRSPSSPPTTVPSAFGSPQHPGYSSADSAPSTAESAQARIRNMLNAALANSPDRPHADDPLGFTPHDFRRIFITALSPAVLRADLVVGSDRRRRPATTGFQWH